MAAGGGGQRAAGGGRRRRAAAAGGRSAYVAEIGELALAGADGLGLHLVDGVVVLEPAAVPQRRVEPIARQLRLRERHAHRTQLVAHRFEAGRAARGGVGRGDDVAEWQHVPAEQLAERGARLEEFRRLLLRHLRPV